MAYEATEGLFYGEKAIWLRAGKYEAALLPNMGANLIAFRDVEAGYKFLREPEEQEMDIFREHPAIYGIPVLFPPNRYRDGKFEVAGIKYELPVNEPATGNHLHGFFYNRPWKVVDKGTDGQESFVVVSYTVDENDNIYQYLPHHFEIRIRYCLSKNGLTQTSSVTNLGNKLMPSMLGFHTAFNAPFAPGSKREDITAHVTTGVRWELDDRSLPTGKTIPMSPAELAIKSPAGGSPFAEQLDNHYSAEPVNGRNVAEVVDHRIGVKLVYDAGTKFKHWMIWNNKASVNYFCPEPQINMVDAPNLNLPDETKGLVILRPGEAWTETSRFYVETVC
ncbi:Aldose 1-epimerase [Paenibacillus curdlanolyticus YK9]|uniref:Aldose 1-epimerase n=1 Tax=Paenibacillus curdlanolyticus YK9 TaxID=717606 RepID=E0ICP2_9BACL|nr:aldose 1-epimerase [Paenibacillus curdlanolyticus]EFM09928.1 Aldose 1-epimerase [Paenibacillus curdlanolyticus YK9]